MLIWKLTDNDFLMELPVGMFLLVVLFLFFFYFAILMTVSADMPLVGCVLTLSLLVLLIFMAAKGLRYQALMTSLNGRKI
ncbi:inner membrane protein [Escherichia coli]|nr:inner membrane protein [Escherichia coli]